jgi:putative tryptophan/tyrosine transport system substrate-binding protein
VLADFGYTQMGGVATIGVDIVPLYRRGAIELMIPMLKGKAASELP